MTPGFSDANDVAFADLDPDFRIRWIRLSLRAPPPDSPALTPPPAAAERDAPPNPMMMGGVPDTNGSAAKRGARRDFIVDRAILPRFGSQPIGLGASICQAHPH